MGIGTGTGINISTILGMIRRSRTAGDPNDGAMTVIVAGAPREAKHPHSTVIGSPHACGDANDGRMMLSTYLAGAWASQGASATMTLIAPSLGSPAGDPPNEGHWTVMGPGPGARGVKICTF